jgi:hypothetical protein
MLHTKQPFLGENLRNKNRGSPIVIISTFIERNQGVQAVYLISRCRTLRQAKLVCEVPRELVVRIDNPNITKSEELG